MERLSHRERLLKALNHEEPDRVPIDLGSTYVTTINVKAYPRLVRHLGLEEEPSTTIMRRRSQVVIPSEAVLRALDIDLRGLWLGTPPAEELGQDTFRDEWGVIWSKPREGHYINIRGPFQEGEPTLADLERHPWPNTKDPVWTQGLRERAQRLRQETDYAIVFNLPFGVVAPCEWLRGFGEWLGDLIANPAFAEGLLECVVQVTSELARSALEEVGEFVDVVMFPDDLGLQNMPLVRPELYRRVIKPRHRRLVEAIKGKTRARVALHSDGCIYPIIGDLIEIGIDILNPIQVSAKDMDTERLKAEFGQHLSFWGAVDTQRVLPMGTPEEVVGEVKRRIGDLAPGGGYILASVHNIQAEVPPENVVAMFDAAKEYGKYPLGRA